MNLIPLAERPRMADSPRRLGFDQRKRRPLL